MIYKVLIPTKREVVNVDFIEVSTEGKLLVLQNDVKSLIKLISLIHEEALRAYWATRQHCGSDWNKDCEPCPDNEQCKTNEQIDKLLKELEA